jgi:adenylate cyclase
VLGFKNKIIFVLLAAFALALPSGPVDTVLYDLKSQVRQQLSTLESPIVIVDIDEASLKAVGHWPWSRNEIHDLLFKLINEQHVSLIGLNLLLPQTTEKSADMALAEFIQQQPIVTALAFDLVQTQSTGELPQGIPLQVPISLKGRGWLGLYPLLAQSNPLAGHINTRVDSDGIVRKVPSFISAENKVYPPLALTMIYQLLDKELGLESWVEMIKPAIKQTELWIPYDFSPQALTVISAKDILANQLEASSLEDSIVLIGSSALGLGDVINTPVGTQMPGVMVQAYLLSAALNNTWIESRALNTEINALGIVLWTLVLILIINLLRTYQAVLLMITVILLLSALNLADFALYGIEWSLTPWLIVFLLHLIWLFYSRYQQHAAKSKQIEGMFKSYVPEKVLQEMIESGYDKFDQGERKKVTVLFADLVGFTSLAETMPPEALTKTTRIIFNALTHVVLENNGTIDKYIGDSLMAFWGAPLNDEQQASNAAAAAQAMQVALNDLPFDIEMGIGINTGEVVVGNIGSDFRHAYSVLGDSVNIAARLESLTRHYPYKILMGKTTASECAQKTQWVDNTQLKGKRLCIDIYTLSS